MVENHQTQQIIVSLLLLPILLSQKLYYIISAFSRDVSSCSTFELPCHRIHLTNFRMKKAAGQKIVDIDEV